MIKLKEMVSLTSIVMFLAVGSFGMKYGIRIDDTDVSTDRMEMVDVGDHRLQIVRNGQGSPTVIFESGLGGREIERWSDMLARIGEITSVVCYARAGRAGSESAKGARTPIAVTDELHIMLERADYRPPYVLVGDSFGALYVRVFAMRFPEDVAGLVLIDGVHERSQAAAIMAKMEEGEDVVSLERTGMADYFISGDFSVFGKLPDVPMVVMTSTRSKSQDYRKVWRDLHSELFQATSNGMHIVTDQAGHSIYVDDPDLVVMAISYVINAVRKAM